MELEEYKFDHFKNIDEVMYYLNYWYKEEDAYSINRYLSLKDFNYISNKYQELQKENKQLKDNWNKLKEDLIKIRQLTFTKYNKNEWENCLSFNDDILPLIEKMKELEQGSDNDE